MKNKKDSSISKMERLMLDLMFGKKKPKTKFEKRLLEQINQIKKEGGIVEIPYD